MILLLGHLDIDPGAVERFEPVLVRQVEESRKEDGCVSYALGFDPVVPGRINVAEIWRDADALAAHRATKHMGDWRAALAGIGGGARHIREYEVDEGVET